MVRRIVKHSSINQPPSNTCISDDSPFSVLAAGRDLIIQAISNSHFFDAKSTLEVIKQLPSNTRIPDDYFFSVVAAGRDLIIQAISNSHFFDAKSTLEVIKQLPTRIPDDYFFSVQLRRAGLRIAKMPDNPERNTRILLKNGILRLSHAHENVKASLDKEHDEESLESESESEYDSDDVLTDKSDFIDDSEDIDDLDHSDGSYDPADSFRLYYSNTPDDSDISSNCSEAYSPTNSVYEVPVRLHKRPAECQGRSQDTTGR